MGKSDLLAKSIQSNVKHIFTADRGVKAANFCVIRETKMPAALVELGFISNSLDAQIIKTKQNQMAEGIAEGIIKFGGLTMKNQPSSWAKEAWEWAKKQGITDGTRPKDNTTREELVTMLYRVSKSK
jgi:N-acetylmuramoyl-L-alanine amidase